MKLLLYASEIAALIGQNPYVPMECARLRVLQRSPEWQGWFHCHPPPPTPEQVVQVHLEASSIVEEVKRAAISAQTPKALEEVMQLCEHVSDPTVAAALTSVVQTSRGAAKETAVAESRKLTQSNKRFYTREVCEDVQVGGRVDGLCEDERVVEEIKNRRRFWKIPPVYDIIQLRVYMWLLGGWNGRLVEVFPDGSTRVTEVGWDPSEWEKLSDRIQLAARFLSHASEEDALEWASSSK